MISVWSRGFTVFFFFFFSKFRKLIFWKKSFSAAYLVRSRCTTTIRGEKTMSIFSAISNARETKATVAADAKRPPIFHRNEGVRSILKRRNETPVDRSDFQRKKIDGARSSGPSLECVCARRYGLKSPPENDRSRQPTSHWWIYKNNI